MDVLFEKLKLLDFLLHIEQSIGVLLFLLEQKKGLTEMSANLHEIFGIEVVIKIRGIDLVASMWLQFDGFGATEGGFQCVDV